MDLSYNKIDDLNGLKDFRRNTHVLKVVELHGNRLNSLKHIVECIANCGTLEIISFAKHGDSNPVCDIPAYRPTIFAQLPNLKILDGKDRHENAATSSDINLLQPGKMQPFCLCLISWSTLAILRLPPFNLHKQLYYVCMYVCMIICHGMYTG